MMEVAGHHVFELEDSSTTEEASTPVVTLDSVTRQKLFEFTNPKEPHQGLVQNSICMEHMTLLENMVRRRLKEKT